MLTPDQTAFLTLIGINLNALAGPAGAMRDTSAILKGLATLSLPAAAPEADTQEFARRRAAIRQLTGDDATEKTSEAAAKLFMELSAWCIETAASINARRAGMDALAARGRALAGNLPEDATGAERKAVAGHAGTLDSAAAGLADATAQVAVQAAFDALETAVRAAEAAGAQRAAQRRDRADAVLARLDSLIAALDPDAAEPARTAIAAEESHLRATLAGAPGEQPVAGAEAAAGALEARAAEASQAAAQDRARRREAFDRYLQSAAAALAIDDAHPSDIAELTALIAGLRKLDAAHSGGSAPGDGELAACQSEVAALDAAAAQVRADIDARRQRFQLAGEVLARLAPDAAGLKAHGRAPQGESGPVLAAAAALAGAHKAKLDWDQVTSYSGADVDALAQAVAAIEQDMAALNAEVGRRIAAIALLAGRLHAGAANPPGTTFAAAQSEYFTSRIGDQETLFLADTGAFGAVEGALKTLEQTFQAFAADLAALKLRLSAVSEPDPAVLPGDEAAALAQARQAAEEAMVTAVPA